MTSSGFGMARQRRLSLALGTSMAALGAAIASPASGQCAPDPTQANATTTCTGVDPNGVRVTTSGTTVDVRPTALVQGTTGPAIAEDIPTANGYDLRMATLTVSGQVSGGTQDGITVLSGSAGNNGFDYYGTSVAITVAAGGSVTGANGIVVDASAGTYYGAAAATVDNAGTIAGTNGFALLSSTPGRAGFASIINRNSGTIGAISGPVSALDNAGTIDGGSRSAVALATGYYNNYYASAGLTNSGTIRSASTDATFVITGGQTLANSGLIQNTVGSAITGGATITNSATGQIIGGNGTAIDGSGGLTNAGRVVGDVVVGAGAIFLSQSVVDSSLGTITGNVTFGVGRDILVARYAGGAIVTGISGSVDGGGGVDSLRIRFDQDATVTAPIALSTNFEQLSLAPADGITAILAPSFTNTGTLLLSGSGTIINRGLLQNAGDVIVDEYGSYPQFTNEGTISRTAAGTNGFAITLNSIPTFTNTGVISSAAGGVSSYSQGAFSNTGTITAAGTGVSSFGGTVTNGGTIRSTNGTALSLSSQATNTGTIEGAGAGVSLLGGSIVNSGQITATGTGVQILFSGQLDNRAGGVISGGTLAIGPTQDYSLQGTAVSNAGTINGDVNLAGNALYAYTNNRYFALPGGVLNGDLTIGAGDYLITQVADSGTGQFAGITGTVTANNSYLRYQVGADTTAAYAPVFGFRSIGYDLFNNAKLTLTSSGSSAPPVTFAGEGSVDLTATIAVTVSPAISTTVRLVGAGYDSTASALAITSRGDLSLVHTDPNSYAYALVALSGTDSFTNAGTITVDDEAPFYYGPTAGIAGGNVVNSGTITLSGAIGVRSATTLTNTGSILQASDGAAATGVLDTSVVNSGTIHVGGIAITNSGYVYNPTGITNAAGGTIASDSGTAVRVYSGRFTNAGTVTGTVDLGYSAPYYSGGSTRSYSSSVYVAVGGTITGDLLFSDGSDVFLQTGDTTGVSGTIDGFDGDDIFGRVFSTSGTVAVDTLTARNFEEALVEADGPGTVATVTGGTSFTGSLYAAGDGSVVNQATIAGSLNLGQPYALRFSSGTPSPVLAAVTNTGSVVGYVGGATASFTNSGSIGTAARPTGIGLYNDGALSFTNSGTINAFASYYYYLDYLGTNLSGVGVVTAINSGSIRGGLNVTGSFEDADVPGQVSVTNGGTIGGDTDALGLLVNTYADGGAGAVTITNSGTIAGTLSTGNYYGLSEGIEVEGDGTSPTAITNTATGTISATGQGAIGIGAYYSALTLDNAGTITANGAQLSIAINAYGTSDSVVRNTGRITGIVGLGGGNDLIENSGTITGNVYLNAGDDRFVQRGRGTVAGVVDGGDGTDTFTVDSTGDGTLAAAQFVDFERLNQIGSGTVSYSGTFAVDTIALDGGTLQVAAGQTLSTLGPMTVTGGTAPAAVVNLGTIAGAVQLGSGDDSYTEGLGSSVGSVDGGAGTDTYRVLLAGDRTGIGARTGFEQLAVEGSGTLSLTLDQSFQSIALAAPGLSLALGGYTVGRIDGSDAANALTLDGDVGAVALGGGDDTLTLSNAAVAGRYDGGAGTDTLRLTAAGPVTLSGTVTGFETLALSQASLTVSGTLGSAGERTGFTDGVQSLTLAPGGTIAGLVDLGSGDDSFQIAGGGTIAGTVAGGAGIDTATVELGGDAMLAASALTGFERLATEGSGTLVLAGGAFAFDRLSASGSLTVAADAALTTPLLTFNGADNRLLIAGGFIGSVDGGAGNDSIDVSGGSAAAPVAFASITNVEALRMGAGYATISGSAAFGTVALSGGRLVGLAGSTITAPTISVAAPATFGSAGTVNANLAVSGTLSPGASPGTMTVNGNVALASGSVSLFEITPAVSDKLLVNGGVTIAGGATLQLVPTGTIVPGTILDLIVASGGITGSFTNVVKPASLFGFVVQDASRVRLFGGFLNNAGYAPQVRRSIDYVNGVLTSGRASAALLAAAPSLVTASGASDPARFAQLTPEAYASARQVAVENGLSVADAGRGATFAARRDEPGLFTFADALAGTRTLEGRAARGTAQARTNAYGFLGGLGWGDAGGSVGAFAGYQNSRQRLAGLGARTDADGFTAGVHARLATVGGWGAKLTLAYSDSDADTRRALTGGEARGSYDLKSWTADVAVDRAVTLGGSWSVRPGVGATVIRSTRGGVTETGNAAFGLNVGRDRDTAVFLDGGLTFAGTASAGNAQVRPYLSLGGRYQVKGRDTVAIGGFGGGTASLLADGAERARVVASATLGADVALSQRLTLFGAISGESGDADHRASARAGLSLAF